MIRQSPDSRSKSDSLYLPTSELFRLFKLFRTASPQLTFKSYHVFSKHQGLVHAKAYLHKGASKKLPHRKTNSFMG